MHLLFESFENPRFSARLNILVPILSKIVHSEYALNAYHSWIYPIFIYFVGTI